MGKYRMEEPWGYQEEKDYQSTMPSDVSIAGLFDKVEYNKSDNKMYFYDTYGTKCGTIDVSEFEEESIVVRAYYDTATQEIVIEFVNGDVVRINVKDVLDENEFKDGLQVIDGQVSVLIDSAGEGYEGSLYLSTSENGVKISGIDKHIFDAVEAERLRATAEELRIEAKLDQEIADRIADVDAEETRAKAEEAAANRRIDRLNDELDAEKTIREAADAAENRRATSEERRIDAKLDAESARATSAETELNTRITNEITRAQGVESQLWGGLNGEITRAQDVEAQLWAAIGGSGDTYTKAQIDEKVSTINGNINSEATTRSNGDNVLDGKITTLESVVNTKVSSADVAAAISTATADMATQTWVNAQGFLTEHQDLSDYAKTADVNDAIALKADKETTYTQEEVDALIKAKETEIYNLTKLVGEIGGNVTYTYPNELGTSLTSLLGNYGTVKLSEDATISRYGPGITAKNKVTLNLNNNDLISTDAGSYGAIMARGTQEITIGGKGTVEAGDGVCIEANGASAVINLTGSTTVYHNNRPGGELIYCYAGTINITNGTFKNDGGSNYTLNCYDANYAAGTAKIIVTGGKFYDFNPADNTAEGEHTSFVPEGYHVEESTDGDSTVYTVKKDA